jgi:hypothetical protein
VLSLHIFVVDAFLVFVEIHAVASVGVDELVPLLLRKVGCYHASCGVTPAAHDGLFVKHDLLDGVVVIWVENTAWGANCDKGSTGEVAYYRDTDWSQKLEKPRFCAASCLLPALRKNRAELVGTQPRLLLWFKLVRQFKRLRTSLIISHNCI